MPGTCSRETLPAHNDVLEKLYPRCIYLDDDLQELIEDLWESGKLLILKLPS